MAATGVPGGLPTDAVGVPEVEGSIEAEGVPVGDGDSPALPGVLELVSDAAGLAAGSAAGVVDDGWDPLVVFEADALGAVVDAELDVGVDGLLLVDGAGVGAVVVGGGEEGGRADGAEPLP